MLKIYHRGELKTIKEIYDEEKILQNPPNYLKTIKELIKLDTELDNVDEG